VKAEISPHSVVAGSAQEFTYTFTIVDTSATASADKFVIHNPFTDEEITVEEILIAGVSQWIQEDSSKVIISTHPDSGHCYWYYFSASGSDSLVILAPASGVMDSLMVTFSEGIPTTTSSSNHFTSFYNDTNIADPYTKCSEKSSGAWDVDVVAGGLDHIVIEDAANGTGNPINKDTLTTDQTLTCYAIGRDAAGNYVSDVSVTWGVTGGIGDVSPGSGTSTTFDATKVGTGTITADDGSGHTDATGTITVNLGTLDHILIRDTASGGGSEVTTHSMTTDETFTLYAAGYDADNNYRADESVSWSTIDGLDSQPGTGTTFTFDPSTSPTSGRIVAHHTTAEDDTTGLITVNDGALSYIIVRKGVNGTGSEATTHTMTTEETYPLWAAGYDADSNYIADITCTWGVTATLDNTPSGPATSTIFSPSTGGTSGQIFANDGSGHIDSTGTITVSIGSLSYIQIEDAANGTGNPINKDTLTTDQTLTCYAIGRDAAGNYVSDVSVTWGVTGGIGDVSPGSGTSTTFDATKVGTGTITADDGSGHTDATGTITVNLGTLASIQVEDAPGGGGNQIPAQTISTGDSLVLYAVGYDGDGNWVRQVNATWTRTGNLDSPSPSTGTSTKFKPTTAPTSGTIKADSTGITPDSTEVITVNPGVPSGSITLTPTPQVIPADGDSSSTISSSEIGDVYGNRVSTGTLITVSTTLGSISGEQVATVATAPNGTITFILQSESTTGGEALVAAHSVNGNAYGTTTVRMEKLDLLTIFTRRSLISQGETDTVSMSMKNEGAGAAYLDTAGLSFTGKLSGDLTSEYTVTPSPVNPDSIASGATISLYFWVQTSGSATVDDTVTISGFVNGTSNSVQVGDNSPQQTDWWVVQRPAQLAVDSVWTLTDTVSQGQTGLTVWMTVLNLGEADAQIEGDVSQTGPVFSSGNEQYVITRNSGPSTINGGEKGRFSYNVNVKSTSSPGVVGIDGKATGRDVNSGYTVSDEGAAITDTWVVQTSANLSINLISTSPTVVSQGQTGITVTMSVDNLGQARALITSSNLNFRAGAVDRNGDYTVTPFGGNPSSIPGLSQRTFTFTVDVSLTASPEYITIDGSVSGQDVNSNAITSDDSAETTDGWTVQSSSDLVSTIAANPNQLSEGQNITVTMTVTNNGGATVEDVTPSALTLSGTGGAHLQSGPSPVSTNLDSSESADFVWVYSSSSGDHGTVRFSGHATGTDANSGNPVSSNSSSSNWITIQTPAHLSIGSISCTHTSVSKGQSGIPVTMTVSNTGETIVHISSAGLTFWQGSTERTSDYIVTSGSNPDSIPGSSSRSFSYQVQVKSNAHSGSVTIKATVTGTDANSGNSVSDNSPTQPHSWVVQTPAYLTIDRIETAPDIVNQGQSGIAVGMIVDNTGQATATVDSTLLTFWQGATDVSSHYQVQLNSGPDSIPGGTQDTVFSFLVDVGGDAPTGNTTLDGRIYGRDANSGYQVNDLGADLVDSWVVEAPAGIHILSIKPSQPQVNRDQGVDWQVFMLISNSGDASVRLDSSRVRFYIGVEVTGEYIIQKPSTFEGSGSTIIPGGTTDSLAFLIDSTGTTLGTATIRGFFWGEDLTSQAKIEKEIWGGHPFQVQTKADLSLTLWIDSPNGAKDDTLSTQQLFILKTLVTNGGEAGVEDSGTIILNLPSGYSVDDTSVNFAVGSPLLWELTAPDSSQPIQLLSAQIITPPLDANTHQPSFVSKEEDSLWVVTVKRAEFSANLNIIRLPGAPQDTVSTNQIFTLKSWVENLGEAGTYGQGLLDLTLPSGYTLFSGSDPSPFQVGDTIEFKVKSPDTSQALDTIRVSLISLPQDENTNSAAWVERGVASIPITTVYAGSVAVAAQISSPSGAEDGILSTDQEFWVKATISATPNIIDTLAFLERFPAGYILLSDSAQKPVNDTVTWKLRAPPIPVLLDTLILIGARGIDQNSRIPVGSSDTVIVRTIEKADLAVDSFVISPEGATDGVVSTNQNFKVGALVINRGQAGVDSTGKLTLEIGNTGCTLLSDTAWSFLPGDTVSWMLSAPESSVPANDLIIRMSSIPNDENTDSTASVSILSDTIKIETVDRADLSISAEITAPPGAVDDTLSTEQQFILTARVTNRGRAEVTGSGELSLDLGGSGCWTADSTRIFNLDDSPTCSVSWEITAPETPVSLSYLLVKLSTVPLDINSGDSAFVSEGKDSLEVLTISKADLKLSASITSPPEAQDGIVSTGQEFTVEALVENTGEAGVRGSGRLSIDFGQTGCATDSLIKPFTINQLVIWKVSTPDYPRATSIITVEIDSLPFDENTDQFSYSSQPGDSIEVETIGEASLTIESFLAQPSVVSQGQENIYLTVEIRNGGGAEIILDSLRLVMPEGSGIRDSLISHLPDTIVGDSCKHYQFGLKIDENAPPGWVMIYSQAWGRDINSGMSLSDSTVQSPESLLVQTPADPVFIYLDPDTVSRGQERSFSLMLRNEGQAGIELDPQVTTLSFTGFSTSLDSSGGTIISGSRETILTFLPQFIDTIGVIDLDLKLIGSQNTANFSQEIPLPGALLVQTPASISLVGQDTVVSSGKPGIFKIWVENSGESALILEKTRSKFVISDQEGHSLVAHLTTDPPIIPGEGSSTPNPGRRGAIKLSCTKAGKAQTLLTFEGIADESLRSGKYKPIISLVGKENGCPDSLYFDSTSTPNLPQITVQRRARLSYGGVLSPRQVYQREIVGFLAKIANSGEAGVSLDSARTMFQIGGYSSFLKSTTYIPGGKSVLLSFEQKLVGLDPAQYTDLTLTLLGRENGMEFGDTIWLTDTVIVRTEAKVSYLVGSVKPRVVSPGEKVTFSLRLKNNGSSFIQLNPDSSFIQFGDSHGERFISGLNPTTSYLWGEEETEIAFKADSVPQVISPKTYRPQVKLFGLQNNESPWLISFLADEIRVEAPSLLVTPQDLAPISIGIGEEAEVLGLVVTNRNLPGGHQVGIRELRFRLDDGKGKPLSPNFLKEVSLKDGLQVIGQGEPMDDGVRIALSSPFLLDPGYRDTLILSLIISPAIEGKSFRVIVDSTGIKASDVVEGVPIGQVYVGSAEDFPLRSKKIVALKADLSSLVSYPNPFDPHREVSHIVYYLPKNSDVALRIYTLTGELVRKLSCQAGGEGGKGGKVNSIEWNGKNGRGIMVRNGVYICQVEAAGQKARTKIAVVK